jgi:hypothetical protein
MSYLRGVLASKAAIRARPPGYVLDLGADGTDVELAERLLRQGTQSADPVQGARLLETALVVVPAPAEDGGRARLHGLRGRGRRGRRPGHGRGRTAAKVMTTCTPRRALPPGASIGSSRFLSAVSEATPTACSSQEFWQRLLNRP